MQDPTLVFPETREEICNALRKLQASDIDEKAPLYKLQHQLAACSYAKAIALTTPAAMSPTPPCKYASEIAEAYAAMDASPDDADIQHNRLWNLQRFSFDIDSGLCISQTGLERIYRAMRLSVECAIYGCLIINQVYLYEGEVAGARAEAKTGAGVRAVLDALAQYKNKNCSNTRGLHIYAIKFLHAVIAFSPEKAMDVSKELDAASIIIFVKHALIEQSQSELVEKCNIILTSL
jgi:hypothetical protein